MSYSGFFVFLAGLAGFSAINEASRGLAFASSFFDLAFAAAAPGFGVLAAFFMRWAVANAKFLNKSVFFIAMTELFILLKT